MTGSRWKSCAAAALATVFGGGGAQGADVVLRVPQDHATIQAAVDAAPPGATILVGKGTYRESVSITGRAGLTITGSGRPVIDAGGGDFGVRAIDSQDVTISGLTVRGANAGVAIDTCTRVVVSGCRVVAPGLVGIGAEASSFLTIERNVLTDVGERGIQLGSLLAVDDSNVERNKIVRSGRAGIEVGGLRNRIADNKVVGAARHAYETYSEPVGSDCVFERNRSVKGGAGFTLHGTGNTIRSNVSIKPGRMGVQFIDDATGSLLESMKVVKAAEEGIVSYGSGNTIRACRVSSSRGDGVHIDADGNVIEGTVVTKAGGAGFRFTVDASGNTVRDCRAKSKGPLDLHDEAGDGANVYEQGNVFRRTRFGP